MKTVYVHPAQMRRILLGNLAPIATRYEGIRPGERIEIADTDETLSVVTKVLKVERRAAGLFRIEIADPATAFSADGNNANL